MQPPRVKGGRPRAPRKQRLPRPERPRPPPWGVRRATSAARLPPRPLPRGSRAADRHRPASWEPRRIPARSHLLGGARAVGSSARGGAESSRSCRRCAEASGLRSDAPTLSQPGLRSPGSRRAPPAGPGARETASAMPSFWCPGPHPSPRPGGKESCAQELVGTCTELQAGAVAARAAAARGGRRARAIPDDGGEGRG